MDSGIFINKCKVKECAVHTHSFIEIAFITDGGGVHKVGNRNHTCTKGEICTINHDTPHQFIVDFSCELLHHFD